MAPSFRVCFRICSPQGSSATSAMGSEGKGGSGKLRSGPLLFPHPAGAAGGSGASYEMPGSSSAPSGRAASSSSNLQGGQYIRDDGTVWNDNYKYGRNPRNTKGRAEKEVKYDPMSHTGDWIGKVSVHRFRTPWAHRRGKELKSVLFGKVKGEISKMKEKVKAQEKRVQQLKTTMTDWATPQTIQAARKTFRKILDDMHMGNCRCVERTCM